MSVLLAHWAASTGAKDLVAATAGQFADRAVLAYAVSEPKAIKSQAGGRGIELFRAALEEAGLIKPRKETAKPTVPEEPAIDPRTAVPQLVDLLWPPLSWEESDLRGRIADLAGDVTALRATWELLALREAAFLIAARVGFGDNEKARKKLETEVNDQLEHRLSREQYAEDREAWFLERLTRYNAAIEEANQMEDPLGVLGVEMELAIGRAFASLIGGNEKALAEIGADQFSESLSQMLRLCMAVAEK